QGMETSMSAQETERLDELTIERRLAASMAEAKSQAPRQSAKSRAPKRVESIVAAGAAGPPQSKVKMPRTSRGIVATVRPSPLAAKAVSGEAEVPATPDFERLA